jgi:hypothetical protein
MRIPTGAIVPLFIASFALLYYQYYRINPDRRLLNLRFALIAGSIVLMFAAISWENELASLVLFLLGLFWVGLSLYLFRFLPPRER